MYGTTCLSEIEETELRHSIEETAKDQLQQSGYHAVRRVSCELDGNVLKLRGRVSSYYEKQIAQSLVLRSLENSVVLENQLEVVGTIKNF